MYWAVGPRDSCGSTYVWLGDYRTNVVGADRKERGVGVRGGEGGGLGQSGSDF